MAALREVIETWGLFCSLYSDRAGHFFVTPKRGEKAECNRVDVSGVEAPQPRKQTFFLIGRMLRIRSSLKQTFTFIAIGVRP
jgi:hypothetical protein